MCSVFLSVRVPQIPEFVCLFSLTIHMFLCQNLKNPFSLSIKRLLKYVVVIMSNYISGSNFLTYRYFLMWPSRFIQTDKVCFSIGCQHAFRLCFSVSSRLAIRTTGPHNIMAKLFNPNPNSKAKLRQKNKHENMEWRPAQIEMIPLTFSRDASASLQQLQRQKLNLILSNTGYIFLAGSCVFSVILSLSDCLSPQWDPPYWVVLCLISCFTLKSAQLFPRHLPHPVHISSIFHPLLSVFTSLPLPLIPLIFSFFLPLLLSPVRLPSFYFLSHVLNPPPCPPRLIWSLSWLPFCTPMHHCDHRASSHR